MGTGYYLLKVSVFLTGVLTLPYSDPGFATAQTNDSANRGVALFDLSKVDEEVVKEFRKAWYISKGGTLAIEAVVLIFRKTDGSYMARSQGYSNQYLMFSFKWDPAAIAIVHTHPNREDARPAPQDERLADRLGVPIFTITNRGMYGYDPATKKTVKVMDGLEWLHLSKWQQRATPALKCQHR